MDKSVFIIAQGHDFEKFGISELWLIGKKPLIRNTQEKFDKESLIFTITTKAEIAANVCDVIVPDIDKTLTGMINSIANLF